MRLLAPAPTVVDSLFPPWQADSRPVRLARDALLVFGFAGFVSLCAQVAVRLPWTTVPITGQTFGVLVTGGALGTWRGASALTTYMLMGMVGISVFAPDNSATVGTWDVHFILPWSGNHGLPWDISSGGYIVGFIFAAWVVGDIAQRGWDRGPWLIAGMLMGNVILYVPGLLWLAYLISSEWIHPVAQMPLADLIAGETTLDKTLIGGLYPFIVGDLIKLYAASLVLPSAWAIVNLRRR